LEHNISDFASGTGKNIEEKKEPKFKLFCPWRKLHFVSSALGAKAFHKEVSLSNKGKTASAKGGLGVISSPMGFASKNKKAKQSQETLVIPWFYDEILITGLINFIKISLEPLENLSGVSMHWKASRLLKSVSSL
jgi:hypothetical protein